jgi:aryl-alcohol dehydrogenase-like predicted oxidoreductase
MEYRKLGRSGLNASVLTLGAWQFGCERWWGKVPEKEIGGVIAACLDGGINTIDTAIGYDDSEIIVGRAIKAVREKLIVVSKGGADPAKIPERADLSLKRMGLDRIDLYLVHYPDYDIPVEDTIGAMVRLKEKGKIGAVGVSNFSAEQLARAASVTDIACCQQAYNIVWREIEEKGTLDVCLAHGIGVLAYSSLGQGLFSGKIRSLEDLAKRGGEIRNITVLFKGKAFGEGLKIVAMLDDLAAKYRKTPAQVAINWVVHRGGISSAIVGVKSAAQLSEILGATGWKMEKEDLDSLSAAGSRVSKLFDYDYSMFGMKYREIKIDAMIDGSLKSS